MLASTHPTVPARRTLRYAFAAALEGHVCVVMSEHGVVDVCSADSEPELLGRLRLLFPDATLVPDRGLHGHWVDAVTKRFTAPGDCGAARFPTDLGGARAVLCG